MAASPDSTRCPSPLASPAVITICVATLLTLTADLGLRSGASYAFGLFLFAPFAAGFASTVLGSEGRGWRTKSVFGWTVGLLATTFLLALAAGTDGAICLLMAAPLSCFAAATGTLLGMGVARLARWGDGNGRSGGGSRLSGLLAFPVLWIGMAVEPSLLPEPPLRAVTTSVIIDATPEAVWDTVIAFPPLTSPPEGVLRLGIAYPVGATLEGEGVGAVRRCEFSTGTFVEPVTVWRPGELLAFDVLEQPAPMTETSPWEDLDVPHLSGSFASEKGEFRLTPTADGKLHLQGTTWYRQHLWPQVYWNEIADGLVHRIHGRVLDHVAACAEATG